MSIDIPHIQNYGQNSPVSIVAQIIDVCDWQSSTAKAPAKALKYTHPCLPAGSFSAQLS